MWPFRKHKSEPKPKDQLVFAFKAGRYNFYQFPESMALPLSRLSMIQEYSTWISRALTNDQMLMLLDRQDELLTEGLTTKRNAAKIGAISAEMRKRINTIAHPDLYLSYLACYYIREDESVQLFNQQIQQEKVDLFRTAANDENSFFFQLKEYLILIESLTTSIKSWKDIEKEFQYHQKRLDELMKITSLEKQ